ncbi:hypothetical protein A4G26_05235 [Mycobacterium kansasii]|nr:hypothetical protein A4G26_05235 [Mycobacterium kansasii]
MAENIGEAAWGRVNRTGRCCRWGADGGITVAGPTLAALLSLVAALGLVGGQSRRSGLGIADVAYVPLT